LAGKGDFGRASALDNDWVVKIVRASATRRDLRSHRGDSSPLKIARGVNKLWNAGGLQYAPPIR
jgi:general L-amino acid transport system substrate-binding protein